jgi:low affinity Fe/Cu permease
VGVVALLFIFEFINLLIHPFIGRLTHHSPLWMLLIMVGIAALLVPLHHKVEKRMTHQLVEKNKRIRLAAAKKTIAQLDKQEHAPGDGEAGKHGGK